MLIILKFYIGILKCGTGLENWNGRGEVSRQFPAVVLASYHTPGCEISLVTQAGPVYATAAA